MAILFCQSYIYSQQGYSIASIPPELTEYANSVILNESVEIDVTDIAAIKKKSFRVIAVLNKLGDEDPRLYQYYDSNSSVAHIEATIYNAYGKEIAHFKKKDFLDVSRTGSSMYADSRALYLNYTPTSYPYIVVFESEIKTGDSAFLAPWFPINGYAESTQKSVLKIKYSPANKPKYKSQNLEGYNITITEAPGELIFLGTDLKTIRYEEHSPSPSEIFPIVYIALNNFKLKKTSGSGTDWQQFGSWMQKALLSDVRNLPAGTIARVKSLVANETTNEGKARKIYQFVQDKVRYISIQIGIGGWKPMPATDVDRLSYGDCKALTNYTKALLDAAGVPSYYTVLYGDSMERDIMKDFTSMQGNHVILGIPDGDEITWLECTSQDAPYGFIGNFTDDRDVLIITPEGGKIAHTKIYGAEINTQINTAKVKVDAQGNVTATFKGISQGLQYGDKYRLTKRKKDEVDQNYKDRWSYINGFSITDVTLNNDREHVVFTEEISLNIPKYANTVGNDYLFCANIFNQNKHIPPRIDHRKQNLYIGYGYLDIDTVEVTVPENFIVEALPEATVLETIFGKYEIQFAQTPKNTIIYTRKLRMEKGEYPPEEYENYRDFLRTITRLDKTKILLKQSVN